MGDFIYAIFSAELPGPLPEDHLALADFMEGEFSAVREQHQHLFQKKVKFSM